MIYENIEALCKEQGISVTTLEKRSGLGNGTIGKWKNSNPKVESLQAVANTLKVKIEKLLK